MAETKVMRVDDPSPPSQRADRSGIQSTMMIPKVCGEQPQNCLHRVLQKATSPSHKDQSWPRQLPSRTAPQNLFLEGFKDCASEVIRFLTEEERVDDNNPLLMGLQAHLSNVSKAICHETIMDLDRYDAEIEKHQTDSCANSSDRCSSQSTLLSPTIISSDVSRSVNSSVSDSDSSTVESDISMSVSSVTDMSHPSFSSENISLVQSTSSEIPCETSGNCRGADDVFCSLMSNAENHFSSHSPPHSSATCWPFRSVLSLTHLARAAVQRMHNGQHGDSSEVSQCQSASSGEHPGFTPSAAGSYIDSKTSLPVQYLLPLSHSSPVPEMISAQSVSSVQNYHFQMSQQMCDMTSLETESSSVPQSHLSPALCGPAHDNSVSASTSHCLPHYQQLFLQQEHHPFEVANSSESPGQRQTIELPSQLSSILELKANFLPGIDTSSVASGSFADILLAIESCLGHEDPRVRALAQELIHLIHNDDSEEDDENDSDEDSQDVLEGNVNNIHRENGDESGIEMMDESVEWGSAADMIEQ